MNNSTLSSEQKEQLRQDGFLHLRGFLDIDAELLDIQKSLYEIIRLVAKRHSITLDEKKFVPQRFDESYQTLLKHDRAVCGEIYDLAKQIPAFLRLVCSKTFEELFCDLRGTSLAGIGRGTFGVRIDNPNEDRFRSHWHQEFIVQPQSLDGIVVWIPLTKVTELDGPVMICKGSHLDGLRNYGSIEKYADKIGPYQIGLIDEDEAIASYDVVSPECEPGDVLLMDFLTLHQSGFNNSKQARWSMQTRFFNFKEDTGMRLGWPPSLTISGNIKTMIKQITREAKRA